MVIGWHLINILPDIVITNTIAILISSAIHYFITLKFAFRQKHTVVSVIIYVGTFFVQLLTWANVGDMNVGVHMRYFIPLLALIPIIFQLNFNKIDAEKFDKYMMVFIIGFMATLILAIVFRFY